MAAKDFELILRVQADLQQAVAQLRTLNDQMRVTKTAATEAGGGLASITTSARAAESGIRSVGTQLTGLNAKFASVNRAAHDLRNVFVFAFAAHEVINFTKSLVDANVEAQRIQNTMEQAFGKEGAAEQLQFVRDLSQKLGLDFKSAAEGFAQLGASAQGTGIQTRDLRKLFTGLSSAATVLHSSTEDVNGVMIQLAQAMSLGKLQMQDIRAISQHLPGTMTALAETAKRMGTNLTAALKSGGLEAKQFIGAFGDVLQERFGEQSKAASHSLNSELNRLHSTLFELQTDGTGFADTFAGAIRDLNHTLSDPALQQSLKNLIADLGSVASLAIKAAGGIAQFVHAFGSVLGIAVARLETGGADPNDQLGLARNELSGVNKQLNRLRSYGTTSYGVNVGASDEEIRRILGLDFSAPVTQKVVDDAIAHLTLVRQNIVAGIAAVKSGKGGPIVPGAPRTATESDTGAALLGPATVDKEAARKAAELAKQAAAAQNALSQSLIGLQSQLNPTAAIYAKYNEAVKKATDEAELAKKAHGANAQAIDTQRDAVIALAGQVRDAALDQLAEKDRAAWEALKRSFETPAQVAVDDALKKIAQLNDLLKKGVIDSAQYHDALAKIGTASVTNAPQYSGPGSSVGGPFGELMKNFQAGDALEAWHQQQLAANQKFRAQDAGNEEAYQARLVEIDRQYQEQKGNIDRSRQQLELSSTAGFFDQLAQLSSSHNKKIAAIGKAASIASTLIKAYQSGTEARAALSGIPIIGPALGIAAEVAAIAAGLANVAQMRSQSVGGYSEGGMTPPGGKYQVAGIVHAGEGVLSQRDVAALGGPAGFNAWRRSLRGFADGGFVNPLANAPSPAQMGFTAPAALPFGALARTAGNDSGAAPPPVGIRIINGVDDAYIRGAMSSAEGETVIMNVLGRNQTRLKQMVR